MGNASTIVWKWLTRAPVRARMSLLLALVGAGVIVPAANAAGAVTLSNWDAAQQRQVVRAGLMRPVGRSFRGGSALTVAQANAAMTAVSGRLGAPTTASIAGGPSAPVRVVSFDRMLVVQLGLGDVAAHLQTVAAARGLRPPWYFGSEVVARFIGLRYNHPTGTDALELYPYDAITRAEAAWSLDVVLGSSDGGAAYARSVLTGFALPALSGAQRDALRIAVRRIGYPYVWGGTTDDTSDGLAHGGFDCSGFVWRVFKVSGLSWGARIGGRTAAQQAGEIPRRARLRMSGLRPGDLLYFGSAHFSSPATASNIIHAGIYLGDNWVIHSSSQGVYVLPLRGSWLGSEFAWGRRVIA